MRQKRPGKGPGRPSYAYGLSGGVDTRVASALISPYRGLVVVSFDSLRRLCRHEKGDYCKEIRDGCVPRIAPKS